jgi:hypothetical protein
MNGNPQRDRINLSLAHRQGSAVAISALGQKQTFAPQKVMSAWAKSGHHVYSIISSARAGMFPGSATRLCLGLGAIS